FAAGAALLVVGFASTATMTLLNASLQGSTPNAVRGRVLSIYTVLAAGMPALGGWALGSAMVSITPSAALFAAGLILVLLVALLATHNAGRLVPTH
ncbi:MAG: MFS transporter, partial [Chloroflexota bacterium]|nr:MFS transporter [Chloroflexota bacterium]